MIGINHQDSGGVGPRYRGEVESESWDRSEREEQEEQWGWEEHGKMYLFYVWVVGCGLDNDKE